MNSLSPLLLTFIVLPHPSPRKRKFLERRFKEAFSKAAQQTKGSYMEVEDNRSQVETDDLILKPGVVHVIDIDRGEEKKGKDPSGEVLSSV